MLAAIDQGRYRVVGVGITQTGRWCQVDPATIAGYRVRDGQVPHVAEPEYDAVWMVGATGCEVATRAGEQLVDIHGIDVAFALLHGPYGEDGTIQGLFEMMGIRYVGSGVAASAIGMDKHHMKQAFEAAGLPVWPYVVITDQQWRRDPAAALKTVENLRYPVYVKPARGGSSLGISRVRGPEQLLEAVELARQYDPKVIIEQGFVAPRELECAVLADPNAPEGVRVSAVGEIRVLANDGFYDFDTKYLDESGATLDIPADIPTALSDEVRRLATEAFHALGCEGLARADVFADTDGQVWLNELNTMPGFTKISMYPALWEYSGVSYPDLVGSLIDLALERPLGLR